MPAYKDFTPYIKAIGAGKRAGRYLTEQEAFKAMSMLLAGEVKPEQKGAFLMLLRVREESVEELSGFVRACREFLPAHTTNSIGNSTDSNFDSNKSFDIDIACYAGKRRQLPWFILAISLLQQNGFRLFMHGTSEPHSTRLYLRDTLAQLGILKDIQAKTEFDAIEILNKRGISYMDLADIYPALNDIIQLRELFGLRSCANTLARLLNPINAKYSVQGVHHQGVDEKHVKIAANLQNEHLLCFRGEGGEPEVNPTKETNLLYFENANKQVFQKVIPAKQSWQIKPRNLNTRVLLDMWQSDFMVTKNTEDMNINGQTGNEKLTQQGVYSYGYHSIMSTLSAIIILTHGVGLFEASQIATNWWLKRDKQNFMSVNLKP